MIKLFLGSLLVATTALGQTPAQAPKAGTTKPTAGSAPIADKKASPTVANTKPIPQSTRSQDIQSGDNAIPSYRMEKDAGVRKGVNRYPAVDKKGKKKQ